jgi:hypothetical protein
MPAEDQVIAIMISLLVEGRPLLFTLLRSDGSINRMGTGRIDSGISDARDRDMFIGTVDDGLFEQLRPQITPGMNEFLGRQLATPNPVGMPCELTVGFRYASGREAMSVWHYGSESRGPHPDIVALVRETVRITEPWFQAQKAMVARQPQAE